ncbi:hypothetical protein Tco_0590648 [Tanacetum coccineum]
MLEPTSNKLLVGTNDDVAASFQQSRIHYHMLMLKLQRHTTSIKIQELKTKTSANSDINDNSSETKLQGKSLESFQEDSKYEHYDAMIELPKCVCNASEGFKKHNQLLKLMQFLMGLDDSYMQIRSSILSREVLPDVRSACATISSKESHRVAVGSIAGSSQRNQASAFAKCFKIIGYPVDFEKKKSGQNFKKQNVSNNNTVGKSLSSGFTDEQMATLISLIKDNKVGKNVQANMAGANQHMTYTDKELDNVLNISHLRIKVGHTNRTKAYISKIGNLRLSNGLTLYDVMVIPEYCVTLISIHKLAKENKIIVAFDGNRCYFLNQDLSLKNVLGIGDQCEGLYYYNNQVAGDGVAGIKRRRRDQSSDGVRNMATASGRGRLKEDLESSTWRRRQDCKATSSR